MILTYKIRHSLDLSVDLLKAKKVADYAVKHKTFSSKAAYSYQVQESKALFPI